MKITLIDRIVLLLTGIISAYQIASGINGMGAVPIYAYTLAFGALLVAGLLIIILGFEVLNSPVVIIISTIIPLSTSLGLVWQFLPGINKPYLLFTLLGFFAIILTRVVLKKTKLSTIVLAFVHGVAGLIIFILPSILAATGVTRPGFALVGVGGALMSIGGLLLSLLKTGKPILPQEIILRIFPSLLLLMTATIVFGFTFE